MTCPPDYLCVSYAYPVWVLLLIFGFVFAVVFVIVALGWWFSRD